jgi:hypothetical protein
MGARPPVDAPAEPSPDTPSHTDTNALIKRLRRPVRRLGFDPTVLLFLAFLFGVAAQFNLAGGSSFMRRLPARSERRVGALYGVVLVTALISPLTLNDVVVLAVTPGHSPPRSRMAQGICANDCCRGLRGERGQLSYGLRQPTEHSHLAGDRGGHLQVPRNDRDAALHFVGSHLRLSLPLRPRTAQIRAERRRGRERASRAIPLLHGRRHLRF